MAAGLSKKRLLTLGLLALAVHGAALWWAQGIWQPASKIKLLPEPIYARLLTPKEPARLPRPQPNQSPQNAAPKAPRAAVDNSTAIATRPLPEPPAPKPVEPPKPIKPIPPAPAEPKAPKVKIPPPPAESKPLFAALGEDPKFSAEPIEEIIDEPSPSPSPQAQPTAALAQAEPTAAPLPTASPAPAVAQTPDQAPDAVPKQTPDTAPAYADGYPDWPLDTRINLKASGYYRGKVTGSGAVTWQRQQNEYQARVQVSFGLGGFSMTSQGEVTPEGLNPRIFEEAALGNVRSAQFETEAVTIGNGKRILRAGLAGGQGTGSFQDSASQFIELAHRFATGRSPLLAGSTVSYWLGRPEGLYQYVFDISGPTLMELPKLGVVSTYHLVPRPIPGLNKDAIYGEMWIAPSLQYLPVKIRMRNQAGTYLDLVVETLEQANTGGAASSAAPAL